MAGVGAAVGSAIPGVGTQLGFSIGALLGGALFPPRQAGQSIGRLSDLKITGSSYGTTIPMVWGDFALPGVIHDYVTDASGNFLIEHSKKKGSKLTGTQRVYSYTVSFAALVCRGPVSIRRIWAQDRTLYDVYAYPPSAYTLRLYRGDETQQPDSLLVAQHGATATPAYRGLAYVVFQDMNLADWSNQLPNLVFEVAQTYPDLVLTTAGLYSYYRFDNEEGKLADSGPKGTAFAETSPASTPVRGCFQLLNGAAGGGLGLKNIGTVHNDAPTGQDLSFQGPTFSLEGWFQYKGDPISGAPNVQWWYINPTSGEYSWQLSVQPNLFLTTTVITLKVFTNASGITTVFQVSLTRDTNWHHVVATYNQAGNAQLYVDGVLQTTVAAPVTPITITSNAANKLRLDGGDYNIDELAFYTTVIAAADVTAHYQEGAGIARTRTSPTVGAILADQFGQEGLVSSQWNVAAATDVVDGYVVPDRQSAREALDPLLRVYQTLVAEYDGKLVAVKRGGAAAATISASDLGAEVWTGANTPVPKAVGKRLQELELPFRVDLTYFSKSRKYESASQGATRYTKTALQDPVTIATPLVFGTDPVVQTHAAVGLNGSAYLVHADADKRFYYSGVAPNKAFASFWVQIHSKVGVQKVFSLGDGASAATDCYGFQYNPTLDRFEAFKSNGGGYFFGPALFTPAVDTWYFIAVTFDFDTIDVDAYTLTGIINSWSTSIVSGYNNPVAAVALGIGATNTGTFPLNGKLDSFQLGFTTTLINSLSLWNSGQAPNFNEVTPGTLPDCRLWADFNELSAAATYADSSGFGSPLTASGTGLTQGAGAGRTALDPARTAETKARQAAEQQLYQIWTEREQFTFSLPLSYLYLAPGDVVNLPVLGQTVRVRIIQMDVDLPGPIHCTAVLDDVGVLTQTIAGASVITSGEEASDGLSTTLIAWSGNALLDTDADSIGLYLAAGPSTTGYWPGATVYWSTDNGASYSEMETVSDATTIGTAATVLAAGTVAGAWDIVNTVDITVTSGSAPVTTSDADVISGSNAALLGDEVIQFATVTALGGSSYRLSRLLRGRRGTDGRWSAHRSGERFVLLDSGLVKREVLGNSYFGRPVLIKAVTPGQAITDVSATTVLVEGLEKKCYAPCLVAATRNVGLDVLATWTRRDRKAGTGLPSPLTIPMSEAVEAYAVDILAGSAKTISAITAAATPTVSSTAHGFTNGQRLYFTGILGMTQLNGLVGTVSNALTNSYQLSDLSTLYFSSYVSGGSAERVVRSFAPTAPTQVYLASQQVSDFGVAQSSVRLIVTQTGANGRGYPAFAVV